MRTYKLNPTPGYLLSVITSDDSAPLKEALKGFKDTVQHPIAVVYDIRGDIDRDRRILTKIQKQTNPDLLFVLGAPALRAVLEKNSNLPVVYAMVPNPAAIIGKGVEHITGVDMNVPVTEVVEVVKTLRSPVRWLGVLFTGERKFADAALSARAQGVKLVPAKVRSPRGVARALRSLLGKIDALWLVHDEILSPEVIEYVLLWSYENKVPVVGLSEAHTRKGALLSVAPGSGREMGRQAGELANRFLRGETPATIQHIKSEQAKLTVNLKAARKLGVEIPELLLARAVNAVQAPVYEEGDWWAFRVEESGTAPREFRVTYVQGRFESNNPIYMEMPPYLQVVHSEYQDRQDFDFPLLPGKKWNFEFKRRGFDRGKLRKAVAEIEVVGRSSELVTIPAGEFDAFEIRQQMTSVGDGENTVFYSPRTKSVVKRSGVFRSLAGTLNVKKELVAYGNAAPDTRPRFVEVKSHHTEVTGSKTRAPGYAGDLSHVKAPVYEEGEWWVFKVKREDKPPEQYRVTYTNGKFESDHPEFLTVSKHWESISFLPLVSVALKGPKKRWFDFPLTPNHTWSFRYPHISGQPGQSGIGGVGWRVWRSVNGMVIGPPSQPINTAAGKFMATEIRRSVATSWGEFEFKYFYSPKTKSTVKATASGFARNDLSRNEFCYEMELVAYGRENLGVSRPDKESIVGEPVPTKALSKIDWSRVEAPVYEEGDWWLFRISTDGVAEEHRIEYKNGQFFSKEPGFLRGKDNFGNPSSLPWATVYLTDPQRKWLDFPLSKGNTWRFRYPRSSFTWRAYDDVGDAEAETVGIVTQPIKTEAGSFRAFEILRIDGLGGGWMKLRYFYSPETKSVVKLRADISGGSKRDFELELVSYGHGHSGSPDAVQLPKGQ